MHIPYIIIKKYYVAKHYFERAKGMGYRHVSTMAEKGNIKQNI
jgi:hypothetical protein